MKLIYFLIITIFSINSFASIKLEIDSSEIPKTKILLQNCEINSSKEEERNLIIDKIKENLSSTNLFEIITTYDENISLDEIPNFEKYSIDAVGGLLNCKSYIYKSEEGEIKIESKVRFWDILDERQIFGKIYSANKNNYKKISSIISNQIFKSITGEKKGHFNTQIAYIAESGNAKNRIKRLAKIDFDGENLKYLTDGRYMALTPIFRNRNEIIFLSYKSLNPSLYNINIKNNFSKKILDFNQSSLAPNINPIDQNIITFSSIDHSGNSDIYILNLQTNIKKRLTISDAIDTTPSFSPDGQNIIFSSDRNGSQKLYMMTKEGKRIRKITSNEGNYSKPLWSPDGALITFTKIKDGKFSIGLITPDGYNERMITSGYLVEGAKWSPNSRYIIYSKQKAPYGKLSIPKIFIIDIMTGFERQVPTPELEGATDPDWM